MFGLAYATPSSPRARHLTLLKSPVMPKADGDSDQHLAFRSTSLLPLAVVSDSIQTDPLHQALRHFHHTTQWMFLWWGLNHRRLRDMRYSQGPKASITYCKHQLLSQPHVLVPVATRSNPLTAIWNVLLSCGLNRSAVHRRWTSNHAHASTLAAHAVRPISDKTHVDQTMDANRSSIEPRYKGWPRSRACT